MGCLEESSVANSIVNIIPYHLLPVRTRAIFVLRCAHGGPVAERRDTPSGQHEHVEREIMPTVHTDTHTHTHKDVLKMSSEICSAFLQGSGAAPSQTMPPCKDADLH